MRVTEWKVRWGYLLPLVESVLYTCSSLTKWLFQYALPSAIAYYSLGEWFNKLLIR